MNSDDTGTEAADAGLVGKETYDTAEEMVAAAQKLAADIAANAPLGVREAKRAYSRESPSQNPPVCRCFWAYFGPILGLFWVHTNVLHSPEQVCSTALSTWS